MDEEERRTKLQAGKDAVSFKFDLIAFYLFLSY